jgi:hypothetical protein
MHRLVKSPKPFKHCAQTLYALRQPQIARFVRWINPRGTIFNYIKGGEFNDSL